MSLLLAVGLIALYVLMFVAHTWVAPIAKLYYEDGFDEAVADALKEIPESEDACIYDDAQNIFVPSIGQLDTGRMIEKAIRDKAPRPRPNGLQRDPHFRVLASGKTYYWSFRDARLYPFQADRWTLSGLSARMCSAYMQSPQLYQEAFRSVSGIAVTAENFCCGLEESV